MAITNSKNKVLGVQEVIYAKALALVISVALVACGKSDQAPAAPPGGMALPVSVIEVQPTSVPISAEAVAQTEAPKKSKYGLEWGAFCSNACMRKAPR